MTNETTVEVTVPKKKIAILPLVKKVLVWTGVIVGTAAVTILLTKRPHEHEDCGCDLATGDSTPELEV